MSSQYQPHLLVLVAFLFVFALYISATSATTEKETNMFKCGDGIGIPVAYIKAQHKVRSKINCAVLCLKYGDVCENMHYVPSIKDSVNCFIGSAVNLNRGYGSCTGLVTTAGVVSFYRKVDCQGVVDSSTGSCECAQGYGGVSCSTRINDCHDTTETGWHAEWVYPPSAPAPFRVMCYAQITFIINRNWQSQGTVSFSRTYEEYATGFGSIESYDYYLGNRNIHYLTNWTREQHITLKIYRHQVDTFTRFYYNMRVLSEADKFRLTIGSMDSNQQVDSDGDAFLTTEPGLSINGMPFTTTDNDQDNWIAGSCAWKFGGGWWYNSCTAAPLTASKLMNSTEIAAAGGPDQALHVDWATQTPANRSIGISMFMFGFFTY